MQRVSAACGQSNWMVWMPPTISSMWLNRSRLVCLSSMIKTSMVFPFGWSRVAAGRASYGQSQRQGGRRAPWAGGQRAATASDGSDGGNRRRQAEHADRLLQLGGLILHRRCRRCRLLDQGGVLLGHLVHLADGGVDLLDAAALLQAGRDYLAHDVADAGDAVDDGLHAGAGLGDQAAASATRSPELPISPLISLAAAAERCARLRTSVATTAKPRPCSPARAASTAAFNARILVWKAMPSMTEIMSTMRLDELLMAPMVSTTWATSAPPLTATDEALKASWLAWRALSAFCRTVEVISSSEEAVSSRLPAWCSVRRDRSRLPAAICSLAVAIELLPSRTPRTVADSLSCILARPVSRRPISSSRSATIEFDRLPPAMASKWPSAWASGPMMARSSATLEARISAAPMTMPASAQSNSLSYSAWLAS